MLQHKLKIQPYDYQLKGIEFGLKNKKVFIADEPGLGKTLQSIGIVDTANAYPCLVVCPSSLKINWQREFEKFANVSAVVLDNHLVGNWWHFVSRTGIHQVAIVNFESLKKYFVLNMIKGKDGGIKLRDIQFNPFISQFKSLIVDECHRVKDPTTIQAKLVKGISMHPLYTIMLSGTPVVNRPNDLLSQLSIMGRLGEFGGASQFTADYCPEDKKAKPNLPQLARLQRKLYNGCMIRRFKTDVLEQLPAKTRTELYLAISNVDEYNTASSDLARYLREYTECTSADIRRKMRMEALVKFMTLRKLATLGKVKQVVEVIQNHIASGQKLIVFCALHDVVDMLKKAFPKAVTVTGRDSSCEKQSAVDSFQNNPKTQIIICSIKAAGVGLTLTASSTVLFLELPWTAADCVQCEDRAHRIGQKDNVTCLYAIAQGTIDCVVYNLIQRKSSVASAIVGGGDMMPDDEAYFDEFINEFNKIANER